MRGLYHTSALGRLLPNQQLPEALVVSLLFKCSCRLKHRTHMHIVAQLGTLILALILLLTLPMISPRR
jgi:hypothetical protein